MMGYWNNPEATRAAIDADGWLHTGDLATIKKDHIRITGRCKEIIVLANGRKIPPANMEASISMDPLFQQVLIVGERAPYLSALTVLDPQRWQEISQSLHLNPESPDSLRNGQVKTLLLNRIGKRLKSFPGFAKVREIALTLEPWTVENGLMTPTLKLRRQRILDRFAPEVAKLYEGHRVFADA